MNENNVPFVGPNIDYTKIPSIHQRRTISFINHFITTTVSFLNNFSLNCEEKLYEFENKLQKLEATIVILESRISSVPGLKNNSTTLNVCNEQLPNATTTKNNSTLVNEEKITQDFNETITEVKKIDEVISKHPLYEKYFKMINVGVPKPAVKIKMEQEGLDPSILENPQQLVSITLSSTTEKES